MLKTTNETNNQEKTKDMGGFNPPCFPPVLLVLLCKAQSAFQQSPTMLRSKVFCHHPLPCCSSIYRPVPPLVPPRYVVVVVPSDPKRMYRSEIVNLLRRSSLLVYPTQHLQRSSRLWSRHALHAQLPGLSPAPQALYANSELPRLRLIDDEDVPFTLLITNRCTQEM